jgi:hypothetical protein
VGDHFYLYENKILCGPDYEERMVFANLSANPAQLAQLKSQTLGRSSAYPSPPHHHQQQPQQGFHHHHAGLPPVCPPIAPATAAKGEAAAVTYNQTYHHNHHQFASHHAAMVSAAVGPPPRPAEAAKDLTPLPPISSVRSNVRALQT